MYDKMVNDHFVGGVRLSFLPIMNLTYPIALEVIWLESFNFSLKTMPTGDFVPWSSLFTPAVQCYDNLSFQLLNTPCII